MTISDDMGIAGTLARIREITAGTSAVAAAAPATTSAATTTAVSGFAQQLAQATQTGDTSSAEADLLSAASTSAYGTLTASALGASGAGGTTGASYGTVNGQPVMILPLGTGTASGTSAVAPVTSGGGSVGQMIARIASAEVGVREQPSGSNDGTRIAQYRQATAGSGVGPWCSYFASWVTAQAGVPIGPDGRGEGWVPNVEQWAKDTGRWVASGSGGAQVGDLIVFDRNTDGLTDHIGVVTGVRADGGVDTVEGNSGDAVSRRSYGAGEWTGLVRVTTA